MELVQLLALLKSAVDRVEALQNVIATGLCDKCSCHLESISLEQPSTITTAVQPISPVSPVPAVRSRTTVITRSKTKNLTMSKPPVAPSCAETVNVVALPATPAPFQDNLSQSAGTDDKIWTTVESSKRQNNKFTKAAVNIRGTKSGTASCSGIEKTKLIHVWSLHPDTTVEALTSFLNDSVAGVKISVHKLLTKKNYASFKVVVPESDVNKFMIPDIWPVNSVVSEWQWKRPSRSPKL